MKTNEPAISVCMPVYNAKRYLAEAVESILGQTFSEFEFLIIDDGSTDGSLAMLKRYAAKDRRIRLWSGPNAGYVPRLNEMLRLARGHLIARMDADDVSLRDRFARQVDFLGAHPEVDVVGSGQLCIDPRGYTLTVWIPPLGHEGIQECALAGGGPISHPSVMMRREAVLAAGGYRVEMMPAEDFDLWLRMGERAQLANLPDLLVRYRMHDQSVSERHQRSQLERMQRAVDEACDRRGLPGRDLEIAPWRPVDRGSRSRYWLAHGWRAFYRRDIRAGISFGCNALAADPWCREGWVLLGCVLLKTPKGAA
jgi:glycosyltransferase involved in cell wall biosynthesis